MLLWSSYHPCRSLGVVTGLSHLPHTTHLKSLMMTSIGMVKPKGEMVNPAIIPISNRCHTIINPRVVKQLQILEIKFDKIRNGFWYFVEIKRCPNEIVRDRTEHIGKIKENNMDVPPIFLSNLDLVLNPASMFKAFRETFDASLLFSSGYFLIF